MNFHDDFKDYKWLFRNAVDWDQVIDLYYKEFPTADGIESKEDLIDFFEDIASAVGDWAGESLAPLARKLDEEGAGIVKEGRTVPSETLQKIYDQAKELAIFGMLGEQKHGGMGLPASVYMFGFIYMCRADIAAATQIGFYSSILDMIERFCEDKDKDRLIPLIVNGDISGSMNLTEPGAGSDVGSLSTTAEKIEGEEKLYKLNGSKIFITNGGGGIGFVLARVKGDKPGLEGISLFMVEQDHAGKEGNNFEVVKNEEKLGFHGSFTCEVLYEDSIGKLVGEESEGFQYMLHLMNEARISVGLQCLGAIEACMAYAREYAETRTQFGKPVIELPLLKRQFEDWETEKDGFRAMMVDTIQYFDMYQKLDIKKRHTGELTKEEEEIYDYSLKWVRRRTPLVKYYGSETFTMLSTKAIQVLGGYGFMKEYDAERWHRDSFAPLLYEGTSQIQSLMCMKDLMKNIMKNPSKFFQTMMYSHPLGGIINGADDMDRIFRGLQYDFKKNFASLIVKTLKPEVNYANPAEIAKLFNAKNWMVEEGFSKLMVHAETICQTQCYLETIRVLRLHAKKDMNRKELFDRYVQLVTPRFEGIYSDWKIRL
ncbi:acyl-CoA dehydrogenase family protein [Bacteriovoracaceae bacterium]|nr:acyl-CoA dehydrogenase family protein [Bacteriovoracaceae bacterium]